jgi:hypothetical protein
MTATFRQNDLRRAIKAARNAGLENFRVDVDRNGRISVVSLPGGEPVEPERASGWDKPLDGE